MRMKIDHVKKVTSVTVESSCATLVDWKFPLLITIKVTRSNYLHNNVVNRNVN